MSQAGGTSGFNPSTIVSTLSGNIGGPVSPLLGNINIVGDGTTISISGDPTTHTLTASVIATSFVQTLSDDAAVQAFPLLGNIQLVGGTNVTTTTVGNTIVIDSAVVSMSYHLVNTTPYVVLLTDTYLSVNTLGVPITIQLPDAPTAYQYWIIKDLSGNAAVSNITVTTVTGAVWIDGAPTYIMNTNYEAINILFNGISYEIF